MRGTKKILALLLLCVLLLTGCGSTEAPQEAADDDGKLKIVASVFPAYDFARAAAGDRADVQLLLPPGAESHSYEPTPADIMAVQDCDLFVYLGGEGETWIQTILDAVEPRGASLKMVDCVEMLEEDHIEGMQLPGNHHHHHHDHEEGHEHHHGEGEVVELDEHVWTSPLNAAAITRAIGEKLGTLDSAHSDVYKQNAEAYAKELEELSEDFRAFFDTLPEGTPLIFGDRFPLRYFVEEYGLRYYAAFPGCSNQTEPSAATIAFLTEKVREEHVSTVFYIEFSNHLVADSIAESTGTKTAMFHTCHNISPEDMEAGTTYLELMRHNLETLKTSLP